MFIFTKLFISLFGIGFIPFASGTFGSLFSIIFIYFILNYIADILLIFIFILIFIISLKLIDSYSSQINRQDSSEIVIDEFLGILFIFLFFDYFKIVNDLFTLILIFILFRFFDIIKIFPANWVDKNIKNSWGVIMDDIIAGVYCIFILFVFHEFT